MAEVNNSYKGNSNKSKVEAAKKERPEIVPIVQGTARKTPLSKRIGASFAGDDANSVGSFLLFDVVLPAVKSLIADATSQGVERLLFGDNARRRSGGSNVNYTSYSNRSYPGKPREAPANGRREMSERARADHDFTEVILPDRGSAEAVLDKLQALIEEYDVASVADLLSSVGITPAFTDDKWGWASLNGARVSRVRDGFMLDMPRPVTLD